MKRQREKSGLPQSGREWRVDMTLSLTKSCAFGKVMCGLPLRGELMKKFAKGEFQPNLSNRFAV